MLGSSLARVRGISARRVRGWGTGFGLCPLGGFLAKGPRGRISQRVRQIFIQDSGLQWSGGLSGSSVAVIYFDAECPSSLHGFVEEGFLARRVSTAFQKWALVSLKETPSRPMSTRLLMSSIVTFLGVARYERGSSF
jgi:hypothetical protein